MNHWKSQPFSATQLPAQFNVNPCGAEFVLENLKMYLQFSIISQHWDGVSNWSPSLWKTRICLSYIFNTMFVDNLVMQGATAWAAMVLTYFSWYDSCFSIIRVSGMVTLLNFGWYMWTGFDISIHFWCLLLTISLKIKNRLFLELMHIPVNICDKHSIIHSSTIDQ